MKAEKTLEQLALEDYEISTLRDIQNLKKNGQDLQQLNST